jgi:hypothetical protein
MYNQGYRYYVYAGPGIEYFFDYAPALEYALSIGAEVEELF